ncbi:MAG: PcfJ domain-containing protein [Bacteroidota bacterium]
MKEKHRQVKGHLLKLPPRDRFRLSKNGGNPDRLNVERSTLERLTYGVIALDIDGFSTKLKSSHKVYFKWYGVHNDRRFNSLLIAFLQSQELNLIEGRIEKKLISSSNSFNKDRLASITGLWIFLTFPEHGKLLLSDQFYKRIKIFKVFTFRTILYYLPKFVFWNILPCTKNASDRRLTYQLLQGVQLRKLNKKFIPFPLIGKMKHAFVHAPLYCTYSTAFLFAFVQGLGGNIKLFHSVKSELGAISGNLRFWKSAIQFFSNCRPLERHQYCFLLRYLRFKNLQSPAFQVSGKTLNSLFDEADHFFYARKFERIKFKVVGFSPFFNVNELNDNIFYIIQIREGQGLIDEALKLNHCVDDYIENVRSGDCSIWSLRHYKNGIENPLVTIEVSRSRQIVQAKGKYNCDPTECQLKLIKAWAIINNLKLD